MRKAQVTIKLEMVSDQSWDGFHEVIAVYADANTPHEALCAATYELLGAYQLQGHDLPGFGRREHTCTPSAAGLTDEEKETIRKQRAEEHEQRLQKLWDRLDRSQRKE